MTIKPLIILPDPVLRQQSKPIEQVDAEVLRLADDMLETMYDAPGIGLAAIQVGVARRMLVIDVAREGEEKTPIVFINPEILKVSDDISTYEEGCLSIPDYYAEVERPAALTVRYVGRDGKQQTVEADGLLATCLQRDRSPERRSLHRPYFAVEARHGHQEIHESGPRKGLIRPPYLETERQKGRGRRWLFASSSWAHRSFPSPRCVHWWKRVREVVAVYTQPPRPGGRRGLDLQNLRCIRRLSFWACPC